MIIVDINGNGDFVSVSDAVSHLNGKSGKVFIKNGHYHERVEITSPGIELIGESAENTVIDYGLYAFMKNSDGGKLGTFRSYTMLVNTHDFYCRDLTVQNSAGSGDNIGQAVAVYAEGDSLCFENCRFLGHQDTLFTGPLPLKEIESGGFAGPTEFSPRIQGRQVYRNCYIEGDVDFIFGSAAAYFDNCVLFSLDRGREVNGYVTASSAFEGAEFGYIFNSCRFAGNCPDGTVYLGRPWRNYAKTVLLNCFIGSHINRELFHDWNKINARNTVLFALYNCTGDFSTDEKAPFVKLLSDDEADLFSFDRFLDTNVKLYG